MPDLPKALKEKLDRGRDRMQSGAAKANECLEFYRGNQYVFRNDENYLVAQSVVTNTDGTGKPRHRLRLTRNFIKDIVLHEVAASTQRVPSYEVSPSTTDPEDISAARLAEKVALYGYDRWQVRGVTERVVTYATVADEGFAWPYFDNSIGPFVDDGQGGQVGQGEVCIRTFGRNEVYWEPGLPFYESPWHAVEQARDVETVQALDGFEGPDLKPDANATDTPSKADRNQQAKLVLVTEYLERPSKKNPTGRWVTIANGRIIVPVKAYPCTEYGDDLAAEPILHKLSYSVDPDSDRDLGLVRDLLDAQRTINHATSKIGEWINLALNPQIIIQNGRFKERLTDEPGQVYHAFGAGQPLWRPVPPIPQELFQQKNEAVSDMGRIAAQNDIPQNVDAARAIQTLIEKDSNRRQAFVANLAEFHSRLMRHCLALVQRHYTEDRLLKIRGRFGPELIQDFQGAQLRSQVDVRVDPGSIEPRTRESIEQRIMNYAQMGWISPEAAMAAINGGTAEALVESYELDVARANEVIQKIKEGPEALFNGMARPALPDEQTMEPVTDPATGQPQIDPATGQPQMQPVMQVPAWMPRPFDNISVHKAVFEDWMKTQEWDGLPPPMQEAANQYYAALLQLEAKQQAQAQAQQIQTAQQLGMGNATRPPSAQMPDQPSPNGSGNVPAPS